MSRWKIRATRGRHSIFGPASAFNKGPDGEHEVFHRKEDADARALYLNQRFATANTHYAAEEVDAA